MAAAAPTVIYSFILCLKFLTNKFAPVHRIRNSFGVK
jgi:hypothetical protein